MTRLLKLFPVILFVFFVAGCKKSTVTPPATIVNFNSTLNGANETPPNFSAATGTSVATYNTTTKILTVTTSYTGITPVAGHIHIGAVGVSGPVEFPFTTLTSPIVFTSTPLNASDESDLMENKLYVNLHSTIYPGGEIRGQLNKQ